MRIDVTAAEQFAINLYFTGYKENNEVYETLGHKIYPLFFTGRRLSPRGIEIEVTVAQTIM